MKKKNKFLTAIAIIAALLIGFMIGISVDYPYVDNDELSGTIGKVDNYRNTKATEADIALKNELLADSVMLNSVKNFMNFYYVRAIKFGGDIDHAITEANKTEALKNEYASEIVALENYGKFLDTARKNLLEVVTACQLAKDVDPAFLRNSIAQANNIVAQMNFRNSAVLNFISGLDAFIQKNGTDKYPELNKVHDVLVYSEIGSSFIVNDKVLLKFFEGKKLYCKNIKTEPVSISENIQNDMAALENTTAFDSEQLAMASSSFDSEKLNFLSIFDAESLGGYVMALDVEKLGSCLDVEKLGSCLDAEKLGIISYDAEKLGSCLDAENLGAVWMDAVNLGAK